MILELKKNTEGRDFICPDIHGAFDLLDDKLAEVKFDFKRDRVISLGDLIDRGEYSHRALSYIKEDWFIPILGNHEDMMMKSYQYKYLDNHLYEKFYNAWINNGGDWAEDLLDEEDFKDWYQALLSLPYYIEYKYDDKLLLMTHADFPIGITWKKLKEIIQNIKSPERSYFLNETLWNRKAAKLYEKYQFIMSLIDEKEAIRKTYDVEVKDVDFAFCGHSFVAEETVIFYNRVFLDNQGFSSFRDYGLNLISIDEFLANNP